MSDHDFEKQVQRKLDELKLRPSNAVWTAIEEDIRQHRPRRRFAFWWPLAFVCLAVTGYIIYAGNQPAGESQPLAQSKSVKVNTSSNSTNKHIAENSTSFSDSLAIKNDQVNADQFNSNENIAIKNSQPVNTSGEASTSANQPVGIENASANPRQPGTSNRNTRPSLTRPNSTKQQATPSSLHPATVTGPSSNNIPAPSANVTKSKKRNTLKPGNNTPVHFPAQTQQQQPGTLASKPAAGAHETTASFPEENRLPDAVRHNTETELAFTTPQAVFNNTEPIATDKAGNPLKNTVPLLPGESTAKAPIQKQQSPKWQFGVMGNAGISRLTQSNLFHINGWLGTGPLSQEKSQAEDLAQGSVDRMPNSPSTSNNNPLVNTVSPTPRKAAPITQGFSWSAGVFAQRPLSKRLRLSIGLQYSYMSVHTTVGKLVERAVTVNQAANSAPLVNRYYTSYDALQMGNGLATSTQFNLATVPRDSLAGQDYTYKFHTIELPITINWQINKGRQLPPFVLDAGISIAQLLSADALHYDGTQDIYYKDNSLFSKTQVNALMGLNIGLFQQSKLPIWVGPHLRYALTGLVRKEVSNGQYLWSTGIQVRMLLNRL